ncbi:MAG: serine--tRNA ligase [Gemmatimonadales bacterium]|nr:MAG: serine--tRNA ligase [Gemmatimonadales bacterium]
MLDIRHIRDLPDQVRSALRRRGESDAAEAVDRILDLDGSRRAAITEADELKARRNEVSRTIGELKRKGEGAEDLILEMRSVGERIAALDGRIREVEEEVERILLETPNIPLPEVQEGGEADAVEVHASGTPTTHPFPALPHWELGQSLGILDLERGARISGSGFPVLRGAGARLQRILVEWMMEIHREEHGYEELLVPHLVTRETLTGTGQLPKFANDSYRTEADDLWLIPTAEVPLTNLHGGELLSAEDLPIGYVTCTPCFRREAGAAGKDTRGLLRVHQFDKVELVRLERPERSREALEELVRHAGTILDRLGLAWRVARLAAGDLGIASAMTYDLEVWAPGVDRWLEVSSCSTCTDYQARRADLRFRPAPGEKPLYLHTLNGSALALPRLVVAILETFQEEDGTVRIPRVLRDRMGTDRISGPSLSRSAAG